MRWGGGHHAQAIGHDGPVDVSGQLPVVFGELRESTATFETQFAAP
jgi:hypothetical protein